MEIREIFETVIKGPLLEVKFRLTTDSDDEIRTFEFMLDEIEEYGYTVLTEDFDLFDFDDNWEDDEYEFEDKDDEFTVDEEELTAFMNEYFLINNNLPPAELF